MTFDHQGASLGAVAVMADVVEGFVVVGVPLLSIMALSSVASGLFHRLAFSLSKKNITRTIKRIF